MLYSENSQVGLQKVSFDGSEISAGLVATSPIPHSTHLLTASGSMSSDLYTGGGFSEIASHKSQRGPQGRRLILGPFRFANHDCDPNCQVKLEFLFMRVRA